MADDHEEEPICLQEARGLCNTMGKLETGVMVLLWDKVMGRFNSTSKSLQKSDQDLISACELMRGLLEFTHGLREDGEYEELEKQAKTLTKCQHYEEVTRRPHKRNRKHDDDYGLATAAHTSHSAPEQSASSKFRIRMYLVVFDTLVSALQTRLEAYTILRDSLDPASCGLSKGLKKKSCDLVVQCYTKLIPMILRRVCIWRVSAFPWPAFVQWLQHSTGHFFLYEGRSIKTIHVTLLQCNIYTIIIIICLKFP